MSAYSEELLKRFRTDYPVGVRHAALLLQKCDNDLEAAKQLFKTECVGIVCKRSGVSEDVALHHLESANFDIPKALHRIEETLYTLTERILRKDHKFPESALQNITLAVITTQNIRSDFWIDFKAIEQLKPEVACFMAVMEWLNYCGYEGFNCALYFHEDKVCMYLNQLGLRNTAALIQNAKAVEDQLNLLPKTLRGNIKNTSKAKKLNAAFNLVYKQFRKDKPLIYSTLISHINKHIHLFP